MSKVEFDGQLKLIKLTNSQETINVFGDIYDPQKKWSAQHLNFSEAMRSVGGQSVDTTTFFPLGQYLVNGWKISVVHGDYTVEFHGSLQSEDGTYPIWGRDWTTDNTLPVVVFHWEHPDKTVVVSTTTLSYAPIERRVGYGYGSSFPTPLSPWVNTEATKATQEKEPDIKILEFIDI